ncbi:MAG: hypothetical protein JXP34_25345, partial [Planctomycetes bacterium]|nr:hypothetical protein [Planctomycetota bacterium]
MSSLPRWFWIWILALAIGPSAAADPPVENTLSFDDVVTVVTQPKVLVRVSVTNTMPLAQLSFGLDYDDDLLRLVAVQPAGNEIGWTMGVQGIQTEVRGDTTWITATLLDRIPPSAQSHVLDLLFELSELIPAPLDWPVVVSHVGARDEADQKPLFVLEDPNLTRTFCQPFVSPAAVEIFTADAVEL